MVNTGSDFHIVENLDVYYHIVKNQLFPLKNIPEFQKKLLLCTVNNSSQPIFRKMKKNSPISPFP